jgi:prepilin peptidase CpaA
MFFVIAPVVLGLLIVATISDVRSREVPDWVSVVIGLVGLLSAALDWLGIGLEWVLAGGALGLVIGYSLFVFASFGGGDAKLIAALGMIVGPVGLLIVLFGMAIAGGVLSLVAILRGQRDYAYVPAITAGFVAYVALVARV